MLARQEPGTVIPREAALLRFGDGLPQQLEPVLLHIGDGDVQLVAWPRVAILDLLWNYLCKEASSEFASKGYSLEVGLPEWRVYVKEAVREA